MTALSIEAALRSELRDALSRLKVPFRSAEIMIARRYNTDGFDSLTRVQKIDFIAWLNSEKEAIRAMVAEFQATILKPKPKPEAVAPVAPEPAPVAPPQPAPAPEPMIETHMQPTMRTGTVEPLVPLTFYLPVSRVGDVLKMAVQR